MTMEFTTTQRGAQSLLHGGYSYMINRRGRDGVVYWRCTRSRNSHCTGSVTTGSADELPSVKNTHNHPPDAAQLEVKKLVSAIKDKTTTDIRPVPQLYQEEVQKVAALPTVPRLQQSYQR